jgi:hypothetical protein
VQQFFKNAAEVWTSSPHLQSKSIFSVCFSCCNCIFGNCQIQTKLNHEHQDCKFRQGNGTIAAYWQAKAGVEPPFAGYRRPFSLREVAPRETICIGFGRIASLSACVLFAGGCVVRIIFVFFLDFDFSEFFMFLEWRTADCLFLLDFNII